MEMGSYPQNNPTALLHIIKRKRDDGYLINGVTERFE
jgi:hypothetical protein|tara:strand:+ start:275 stop:385 length:111 start_codon:yes stop_codon:yes gene_type:complete